MWDHHPDLSSCIQLFCLPNRYWNFPSERTRAIPGPFQVVTSVIWNLINSTTKYVTLIQHLRKWIHFHFIIIRQAHGMCVYECANSMYMHQYNNGKQAIKIMCVIITENYIKFVCLIVCRSWENKSTYVCIETRERGRKRVKGLTREHDARGEEAVSNETSWQPFILNSVCLPNHYARLCCAWASPVYLSLAEQSLTMNYYQKICD